MHKYVEARDQLQVSFLRSHSVWSGFFIWFVVCVFETRSLTAITHTGLARLAGLSPPPQP